MECRDLRQDELEQHIKRLKYYGYTTIESFVPAETVLSLRARVEAIFGRLAQNTYSDDVKDLAKDRCIHNLQNHGVEFIRLLSRPTITHVLRRFLNDPYYQAMPDDNTNCILSNYTARSAVSGLDLHIDSFVPSPGEMTWSLVVGFVLDDQTRRNGCSVVVPGSHRLGTYCDRSFEHARPVESKAGDVVLWDSRIWHGNLENPERLSRWVLFATFNMWWVRPNFDVPRGLPQSIYAQLTDEEKTMMGFCAITPTDEFKRFHAKRGHDSLLPRVDDYFKPTS